MRYVMLFVVALSVACVTNRTALNQSHLNAVYITQIHIAQTMDEVQKFMKHPPESRTVKVVGDGSTEETWNYLTDYNADTNTTLVFRGGKLVEINPTRWLGNGDFKK